MNILAAATDGGYIWPYLIGIAIGAGLAVSLMLATRNFGNLGTHPSGRIELPPAPQPNTITTKTQPTMSSVEEDCKTTSYDRDEMKRILNEMITLRLKEIENNPLKKLIQEMQEERERIVTPPNDTSLKKIIRGMEEERLIQREKMRKAADDANRSMIEGRAGLS